MDHGCRRGEDRRCSVFSSATPKLSSSSSTPTPVRARSPMPLALLPPVRCVHAASAPRPTRRALLPSVRCLRLPKRNALSRFMPRENALDVCSFKKRECSWPGFLCNLLKDYTLLLLWRPAAASMDSTPPRWQHPRESSTEGRRWRLVLLTLSELFLFFSCCSQWSYVWC